MWYETGDIEALLGILPCRTVAIDIETTGLDAMTDEVLRAALVDGNGRVRFDELMAPERHGDWRAASLVNGIDPHMVAGRSPLAAHAREIASILQRAELIVGFNLSFDLAFLHTAGIDAGSAAHFDVMREFSAVVGGGGLRGRKGRVTLAACARHYGIAHHAHDALDDACAAMACFKRMLHDDGTRFSVPGTIPYLRAVSNRR